MAISPPLGGPGAHWLSLPYWEPEPRIQAGTPSQGWLLASSSLCIKRLHSAECLMYTNSRAHPGVAMGRASTPTSRYSQPSYPGSRRKDCVTVCTLQSRDEARTQCAPSDHWAADTSPAWPCCSCLGHAHHNSARLGRPGDCMAGTGRLTPPHSMQGPALCLHSHTRFPENLVSENMRACGVKMTS
ncbi:Serine/Threonine-Protein Kinase Tao1 [Manis pentadactyla]|nr:Serine/Threonine-Protein Kinase Tao1 [Manis pentadactyla]